MSEQDCCCAICLDNNSTAPTYTTVCNHIYHRCCIYTWFNRGKDTCPNCRRILAIPEELLNIKLALAQKLAQKLALARELGLIRAQELTQELELILSRSRELAQERETLSYLSINNTV